MLYIITHTNLFTEIAAYLALSNTLSNGVGDRSEIIKALKYDGKVLDGV